MALLASTILLLTTIGGGVLGYHRGRRLAVGLLLLLLGSSLVTWLLPWLWQQGGPPAALLGLVVLLGAGWWLRRRFGEDGGDQKRSWRLLGMVAGGLLAVMACLLVSFGLTLLDGAPRTEPRSSQVTSHAAADTATASWADLQRFGSELGRVSGQLLGQVPVVGDRAAELQALQAIVNADPQDIQTLAHQRGIHHLLERPSCRAALDDEAFMADVAAVGNGDLMALHRLVDSPHVVALERDPAIRALVSSCDLIGLANDLEQIASKRQRPGPTVPPRSGAASTGSDLSPASRSAVTLVRPTDP